MESTAAFARGYRFGRRLPSTVPDSPPFLAAQHANELALYFDAHTSGPGLWKWRHYFDIYDRHLARFRGHPARMVEVGVFGGGSLAMWRSYLGSASEIIGVDIDPACARHASEGIDVVIGDQADPAFWADFVARVPPIDIILDDGGHQARQQIPTLEALLPHLRRGGVYICEDLHRPFQGLHAYLEGLTRQLHAIPPPGPPWPPSGLHQHVASVHHYPLISVIETPHARVPDFEAPRRGSEWPDGRTAG